jgi:hypothetical protein
MAYTLQFGGNQVVCDTVAEVKAILAEVPFEISGSRRSRNNEMEHAHNKFAAVVAALTKTQWAFLQLLASRDAVSDSDARTSLILDNNKELAGVLAAIHTRFKNAGIGNPVQTEKRFKGGNRSYRYWLSETDRKIVTVLAKRK